MPTYYLLNNNNKKKRSYLAVCPWKLYRARATVRVVLTGDFGA